jgi:hypothetical protein
MSRDVFLEPDKKKYKNRHNSKRQYVHTQEKDRGFLKEFFSPDDKG